MTWTKLFSVYPHSNPSLPIHPSVLSDNSEFHQWYHPFRKVAHHVQVRALRSRREGSLALTRGIPYFSSHGDVPSEWQEPMKAEPSLSPWYSHSLCVASEHSSQFYCLLGTTFLLVPVVFSLYFTCFIQELSSFTNSLGFF